MALTAATLVTEIFARQQPGLGSNMRRLTQRQFDALRGLLLDEKLYGTVHDGDGGSLIWTPPGKDKIVLTEDRISARHTLTRLPAMAATGMGLLFQ